MRAAFVAMELVHFALLILLVVAALGMFKPGGLTRHGRRKEDEAPPSAAQANPARRVSDGKPPPSRGTSSICSTTTE